MISFDVSGLLEKFATKERFDRVFGNAEPSGAIKQLTARDWDKNHYCIAFTADIVWSPKGPYFTKSVIADRRSLPNAKWSEKAIDHCVNALANAEWIETTLFAQDLFMPVQMELMDNE